jgi:hypothetical protein
MHGPTIIEILIILFFRLVCWWRRHGTQRRFWGLSDSLFFLLRSRLESLLQTADSFSHLTVGNHNRVEEELLAYFLGGLGSNIGLLELLYFLEDLLDILWRETVLAFYKTHLRWLE